MVAGKGADTEEKVPEEKGPEVRIQVVRVQVETTKGEILEVKLNHKSGNFYVSPGSVSGPFASFA